MDRIFDFIANTTDGVFVVDRSQTLLLWNEGATAILGFPPADVIGKKCEDVLQGQDAMGCAVCRRDCKYIKAASRLEFSPTRDMKTHTKQGLDIWINVSSIVVPSQRNELSALVHLFRDVTHQHGIADVAKDLADMVSGVSSRSDMPPSANSLVGLTPRERDVMRHLATGATTQMMANRMHISPTTVRNHVHNILEKLDVHSRLEAVAYSIRPGLV